MTVRLQFLKNQKNQKEVTKFEKLWFSPAKSWYYTLQLINSLHEIIVVNYAVINIPQRKTLGFSTQTAAKKDSILITINTKARKRNYC